MGDEWSSWKVLSKELFKKMNEQHPQKTNERKIHTKSFLINFFSSTHMVYLFWLNTVNLPGFLGIWPRKFSRIRPLKPNYIIYALKCRECFQTTLNNNCWTKNNWKRHCFKWNLLVTDNVFILEIKRKDRSNGFRKVMKSWILFHMPRAY